MNPKNLSVAELAELLAFAKAAYPAEMASVDVEGFAKLPWFFSEVRVIEPDGRVYVYSDGAGGECYAFTDDELDSFVVAFDY